MLFTSHLITEHFHHPKRNSVCIKQSLPVPLSLQALGTTEMLSVSIDLSIKSKWTIEMKLYNMAFCVWFFFIWFSLSGFSLFGFLGGSDGKASACNAGHPGLIPGLGRSPGEGNGNPLQYSCLENSMDGGVL